METPRTLHAGGCRYRLIACKCLFSRALQFEVNAIKRPKLLHLLISDILENGGIIRNPLHLQIELLDSLIAVCVLKPRKEVACRLVARIPVVAATPAPMRRRQVSAEADIIYDNTKCFEIRPRQGKLDQTLACNAFNQPPRTCPFRIILKTMHSFVGQDTEYFMTCPAGRFMNIFERKVDLLVV